MKKVMFTVAAVLFALATQAAAVNWTASNIYAGDGSSNKGSGYVGYLFLADQVSAAEVTAAINGGNWSTVSSKALAEQYSTTAGKFTGAATASPVADSYGGQSVYAYAVIFNAGSVDTATKFYVTPELQKSILGTGSTSYGLGSLAASQTASWGTVPGGSQGDIPEPTSGLLLLVGGAMLALRRKQK